MSIDSLSEIKARIDVLSKTEQAELADYLIHSLFAGNEADTVLDQSLVGRLNDMREGRDPGIAADELFAELRRRWQ